MSFPATRTLSRLLVVCLFVVGASADGPDVAFDISAASLDSMASAYLPQLHFAAKVPGYTTTSVKGFLPLAYEKCADCALNVAVRLLAPPTVTLAKGENLVYLRTAEINLTAVNSNEQHFSLLLLELNGTASAEFGKQVAGSSRIPVTIKLVQSTSAVLASYVGDVGNSPLLSSVVNAIASGVIIPQFNRAFPGIYLPLVAGIRLENVMIQNLKDGKLTVLTDLAFAAGLLPRVTRPKVQLAQLWDAAAVAGMEMTVYESGMTKMANNFAPELEGAVNAVSLPAFDGSGSVSGIEFQYSVDTISVRNFKFSSNSVSFREGAGPILRLSGIQLSVPSTAFVLKKHMYITWLSCDGTLQASLSGAAVSTTVNITKGANGAPVIAPASSWDWGELSVTHQVEGTLCSWANALASLFDADVNGKITSVMKTMIPPAADKVISAYAKNVVDQLTPNAVPFDTGVTLDMSLEQNPLTSDAGLEFDFVGLFAAKRA